MLQQALRVTAGVMCYNRRYVLQHALSVTACVKCYSRRYVLQQALCVTAGVKCHSRRYVLQHALSVTVTGPTYVTVWCVMVCYGKLCHNRLLILRNNIIYVENRIGLQSTIEL